MMVDDYEASKLTRVPNNSYIAHQGCTALKTITLLRYMGSAYTSICLERDMYTSYPYTNNY